MTVPDPEIDDPNAPDSTLPQAERDKIRDIAAALVDGSLSMGADAFTALSPRISRRAWVRYQAAKEDRENVRERNARQRAAAENHEAVVAVAAHAEELREQYEEDRGRDRPRRRSTAPPGTAAAMEMVVAPDDSRAQ